MSEAAPADFGAPTLVFVHGARADGSCWTGVLATQIQAGESMTALASPLRDVSGTIDELWRIVGAIADGLHIPDLRAGALVAEVAALPTQTASTSTAESPLLAGGLSAREIDVLRLVAEGLTNVQIAERLFISPKTVSTHLISIFGKLGVNSRSGATRFAIEHGLT